MVLICLCYFMCTYIYIHLCFPLLSLLQVMGLFLFAPPFLLTLLEAQGLFYWTGLFICNSTLFNILLNSFLSFRTESFNSTNIPVGIWHPGHGKQSNENETVYSIYMYTVLVDRITVYTYTCTRTCMYLYIIYIQFLINSCIETCTVQCTCNYPICVSEFSVPAKTVWLISYYYCVVCSPMCKLI